MASTLEGELMDKEFYLAQAAWVGMDRDDKARFLEWLARETGAEFDQLDTGWGKVRIIGEMDLN